MSGDVHEFRVRILGCGSSGGVPRLGGDDGHGDWGVCDPCEPRNRRTRCSVLVERRHPETRFDDRNAVTSVLVDTSPDMREQLLVAGCARLDAVLITHHHADQTHGLDDLRAMVHRMKKRMPVWIDRDTAGELLHRFSYCFRQPEGSWYPPILEEVPMPAMGKTRQIDGPSGEVPFTPFLQGHGPVDSLGFRFGTMAYSSDVHELPAESFELLEGLDLWIVDALQIKPHGTHAHLEKTLGWIERLKPRRAVLTNLHNSMDYRTVSKLLPEHVVAAYDGMELSF